MQGTIIAIDVVITICIPTGSSQWCRGVMVMYADSQHTGCNFGSPMCHF